jgi:hypothetical protein
VDFKKELIALKTELPNLGIPEGKEAIAVSVYNIYKHHGVSPTEEIIRFAMDVKLPPKNHNDYYYLATVAYLRNNGIKKVAYPLGHGALSEDLEEEFDLEKWSGLVHKIYEAVQSGDMSYSFALDYYSGELDTSRQEGHKFKEWVKYYKNGEHLKYDIRASRSNEMEKKADFQFPLSGSGFYPAETKQVSKERVEVDNKKGDFEEWKSKLYVAIRRLDKLIRQGDPHMNSDIHADLADLLHAFDMEVRKVRLASTASDLTKRAALAFKTKGLNEHADTLYALAQETPLPPEIDAAPDDILGDEPLGGGLTEEPEVPGAEGEIPGAAPESIGAGTPVGTALKGGTGPKPGEYEALSGDITLDQASRKLEEIAGRLADRRVIRLLAEFDIMLDQLGVAPMFPELPEAQSKLIDSYSYALTRVTKMLGMLSSGKSLSEIADAKETEIQKGVDKDTAKTFNAGAEEDAPKGTEAIADEFGATTELPPEPGQDAPQPAEAPPIDEEV